MQGVWDGIFNCWHSTCFVLPQGALHMFNNVFGIHERALMLYGQRLGVLASNMANADTPGYKARDIDFAAVLGSAGEADKPLELTSTSASHITIGSDDGISGDLLYRNPYQASLDGNTVEMPVEQAAFAENSVRYQACLALINGRIAEHHSAISGQ
jgi:flagellar basal-body rod protein FlgB